MSHTIIEDSSPFYFKFTHDGLEKIISICQEELKKIKEFPKVNTFLSHAFSIDVGKKILDLLPLSKKITFQEDRVTLFISAPGYKHYVHIDGAAVSVNYGVSIVDNKCITNWYSNIDIINNFNLTPDLPWNRSLVKRAEFNKSKQLPIKSFLHRQQEAIIFNSLIYHDFDNTNSKEYRSILTLRPMNKNLTLDDIKQIMSEE